MSGATPDIPVAELGLTRGGGEGDF